MVKVFGAVVVGLLLASAAVPKSPRPEPCPIGRFLLPGEGHALLTGASTPPTDAVVLGGTRAITIGTCPAKAIVKARRRFTSVQAAWPRCGNARKIRLTGKIGAPACDVLIGKVRAKGQKWSRFTATRSTCGDRILDLAGGEACDATAPGGDGACAGRCRPPGDVEACTCAPASTSTVPTTSPTTTSVTTTTSTSLPVACGAPGDPVCGGRCDLGSVCEPERDGGCRCAAFAEIPCRVSLSSAVVGWEANLAEDDGAPRANGRQVSGAELVGGLYDFTDSVLLGPPAQRVRIDVRDRVLLDASVDCPRPAIPDERPTKLWGGRLNAHADATVVVDVAGQPSYTPIRGLAGAMGDGIAVVAPGEEVVLQVEAVESGSDLNGAPAALVEAEFTDANCEYLVPAPPQCVARNGIPGSQLAGRGQVVVPYDAVPAGDTARGELRTAYFAWFGHAAVSRNVPGTQRKEAVLAGYRMAAAVRWSRDNPLCARAPEVASRSASGQPADRPVIAAAISGDGRFVVFQSAATNLGTAVTGDASNVYLYDRQSAVVQLVSRTPAGTAGNAESAGGTLSADGRFVAFFSLASDLVLEDTNELADVFVWDRITGVIERASLTEAGGEAHGLSAFGAISGDGTIVAFHSQAPDIVTQDIGGGSIFVRDRVARTTQLVSRAADGTSPNGPSTSPAISADGQVIAFESDASNLVSGDLNGVTDIFTYDRRTGLIDRVSIASNGTEADKPSYSAALSGDGRFVAFWTEAGTLVSNDSNAVADVFVRDRLTGTTERVSLATSGAEGDAPSPHVGFPAAIGFSLDGRYVTFASEANNLAAGDTNDVEDVFVRDRQTGVTERVSVSATGVHGFGRSFAPTFSSDGRSAAFVTLAPNLGGPDAAETPQAVVRSIRCE